MDDKTQEAILKVLLQISQTLPTLRDNASAGNMSTYAPMPSMNRLAHLTRTQSGGGILDLISQFVPGLHTTDEFGNSIPIINTNLTARPSGMSGFAHAMMRQNTRSYNAGVSAASDMQARSWNRAISSGGTLEAAIERLVPPEARGPLQFFREKILGGEIGARFAMPAINAALGYDRGEGVNVSLGRSMGVLAGIDKNYGGIFPEGTNGSNYNYPRRMNWGDFLSDNYNRKRMNVQSTIDAAVQDIMYREDATKKGTITKRGIVHGASDKLVTTILADAMQSGALDEYLRANPTDYQDAATGKRMSVGSMGDLLRMKERQQDRYDTAVGNRSMLSRDLEEAEARGDTSAAEGIRKKISDYDREIESAKKALSDIDGLVSKAAEPLVEAVTGAVSALSDFYGSETESKEALDRLTAGEGSRNRAVANRVHDQINEIKVLGAMSGLGAEAMGIQLDAVQSVLGGGSARGARYAGAKALNFQRMFANQIAAVGGDAGQTEDLMRAQTARAASYGESEADAFTTLLEVAKKKGAFSGRNPEDLSNIIDLATSGRYEDFEKAKKMLGRIGFGSEAFYDEIANDPAMLTFYASKLTEEERNSAGALGVRMSSAEDKRMSREGLIGARERRQMYALTEAGIDATQLENEVGNRDYQAIMDSLDRLDVGPDKDEGAATAREMMKREFEAAKKRMPGISDEEARKIAAENFTAKGYDKLLSSASRDEIFENRSASRYSALMDAEQFRDNKTGQLYQFQATEFLQNIGAAGQDGSLTRSAFSQASRSMFDFLNENAGSGILRSKDGKEISAEEIQQKQEQFDKLMAEGRYNEAYNLFNDLTENLDPEGKKLAQARLTGSYRTMDQIEMEMASRMTGDDAKKFADLRSIAHDESKSDEERQDARDEMSRMAVRTQQETDLIDEVSGYGDMAKRMAGMDRQDALAYAEAFKDSQNYELTGEEREKAQKRMREIEAKHENDAKSDLEKIFEGLQGDTDQFAEALKNAGLTVDQFRQLIEGFIEFSGGKVKGESDKTEEPEPGMSGTAGKVAASAANAAAKAGAKAAGSESGSDGKKGGKPEDKVTLLCERLDRLCSILEQENQDKDRTVSV